MRRPLIRQYGYVVDDAEEAMKFWVETLGVGPFYYRPRIVTEFTFRNTVGELEVSVCLAQSGSVQIELLQQHNRTPSLLNEFTNAGRTGLHHVAFWTTELDRDVAEYAAQGKQPIQTANPRGGANRNCFFLTGNPNCYAIELSEVSGAKGELFAQVANAAEAWDGQDPVRWLPALGPPSAR